MAAEPDSAPRSASSAPRSRAPLAVALALLGLFGAAIGVGQLAGFQLPGIGDLFAAVAEPEGAAAPVRITIPTLDVRARVVGVGNADDGSIAVPTGDPTRTTGWYDRGPHPGEPGTAVIVGHVDTADRPAVFNHLADLSTGATIEVTRRDHHVAEFTVDSVASYPKSAFPGGKIFAAADRPRLVLVTCGGRWVGGDVGYADNIIVFASLAAAPSAAAT